MKKIFLKIFLISAVLVFALLPGTAFAKSANATGTPTISVSGGSDYKTTVKIALSDIPDNGTVKASESIKFSSNYVSISSLDYLRVKFSLLNGASVTSVTADITKSGATTTVNLPLYSSDSSGYVYRVKIDGTVSQININLRHNCEYDYTKIPASVKMATCTQDGTLSRTCIHCGGVDTQINEKAKGHKWNAGTITIQPTEESEGEITYKCTVCEGTKTESIDKLEHVHSYVNEVVKEEYLAAGATCESGAKYYKSCKCGATGEETFVSGEPAAHNFANYVSDGNATCTENGTKTAVCTICGKATDTVEDVGSAKGHNWDGGTITTQPTEESEGEITYSCKDCEAIKKGSIDKLEHAHSYVNEVVKEEYLAAGATCESGAKYYKSCKCGATGEETFVSGEPAAHNFANYVSDGNATCTENGTKTAVCTTCGKATDTVEDVGSAKGHSWDGGTITTQPTEESEGEITYSCKDCEVTKTQVIPKTEKKEDNKITDGKPNDNVINNDNENKNTKVDSENSKSDEQTQTVSVTAEKSVSSQNNLKTGEESNIILLEVIIAAAAAVLVLAVKKRKLHK